MIAIRQSLLLALAAGLVTGGAIAQNPTCPARPNPGSVVNNPPDVVSQNGVLNASFTFYSSFDTSGYLHECYVYQTSQGAVEAPTLRLNPGDQLALDLTNRLTYLPPPPPGPKAARSTAAMHAMAGMAGRTAANDPCTGGTMVATSTNIHFHGLNIPPKCHEDEILMTDIENTDPPFQYRFQIPANDAPGMYWYHPHLHGVVTLQVNGGAPGALIIGGIEKLKPQVAGLPERVFVVRQQFTNPNSWIAGPYQLTLNYQPAVAPYTPSPIIQMKPRVKEFWRVANASSQGFLSLQVWFGSTPQKLEVVELDGIPVAAPTQVTTLNIPPAGRAEFIMQGPAANQTASFQHIGFNTGPIGNPNPAQELATIVTGADAQEPPALPAASGPASTAPLRFAGLDTATVTAKRKIYFAEATNGSNGPTEFFITVDGQKPIVFSMSNPPAITTTVGAVEDWTVENRTGETHAFHIHQIHFLFLAVNGVAFATPDLRDTVIVPAWSGTGPYPTVTLRMDFREPQIAGSFVFHCHVLDHEDAGMMAIVQVNPK
ncbi:MAG: multicopper oxidase domain-containing protein [Bryobacteraceae bacterium]|jgi:FtsP/CotA-like multicopper oxidase with cupredoxin domain